MVGSLRKVMFDLVCSIGRERVVKFLNLYKKNYCEGVGFFNFFGRI